MIPKLKDCKLGNYQVGKIFVGKNIVWQKAKVYECLVDCYTRADATQQSSNDKMVSDMIEKAYVVKNGDKYDVTFITKEFSFNIYTKGELVRLKSGDKEIDLTSKKRPRSFELKGLTLEVPKNFKHYYNFVVGETFFYDVRLNEKDVPAHFKNRAGYFVLYSIR